MLIAFDDYPVRLSAGRESMSESTQALCFLAGANSIFTGDKLLTAPNAGDDADGAMFARLGLKAMAGEEPMRVAAEILSLRPIRDTVASSSKIPARTLR